jgi:hypothetical protein
MLRAYKPVASRAQAPRTRDNVACVAFFRTFGVSALSLALLGCGRLGFEPRTHAVEDPRPSATPEDGGVSADAAQPELDAGTPSKDKPSPEPADAGEPADGDGDASAPAGDDGGVVVPSDDGGSVQPGPADDAGVAMAFACGDYADNLGCWDFSGTRPSAWSLQSVTGDGEVTRHDGMVDAQTWSVPADAYARLAFDAQYSGTLYLRMRVMFPSDGELASINFLTVGNYQDDSDYGIELDAIDGKLAFNSSADGFRYSDYELLRDQWLCIDASLHLARYGEMSVRVDGEAALDVTNVDTVPSAGTKIVHVGIDWTRGDQDFGHVLVDEFVISRSPVACP